MSQATGATSRVLGWDESTYNTTPGSPAGTVLHVQNFQLKLDEARDADPTLSGYRGQPRSTAGRRDVSGNVQVSLAPESIGFWLKHLIGTPTTIGTDPYTHTFQPAASGANALPAGMGFEVDYSSRISTPGRFLVYSGCRISKGTFTFPTQGVPSMQLEVKGADLDADNSATLVASPTDPGHAAWGVKQIALEWDDGAQSLCLENLTVTYDNDLDDSQFCVGNGAVRHALPEGFALLTGQGVAFFDTASLMNAALNDDDVKLKITLSKGDGLGSAGNESLVMTIPKLVIAATTPPIDGPKGLKLTFNFNAFAASGAELGFTAVLKNAQATI